MNWFTFGRKSVPSAWSRILLGLLFVVLLGLSAVSAQAQASFTVSVTLSNTSPRTLDRLTATPSNSNGASLTYSYVWKRNGNTIPGQTNPFLDLAFPGNGDKGDTITVEVTGSDGQNSSAPATASAMVINSAPEGVLLTTTSLGRQIISRADAIDPDGDSISYAVVPNSTRKGNVDGFDAGDGLFLFTPSDSADVSNPFDINTYAGFTFAVSDNDGETSPVPVGIILTPPPPASARKYVSLGSNDTNAIGASDFSRGYTSLINGKINTYANGFPTYALSNRGFNGLRLTDLPRKVGGKSVLDLVAADNPAVITAWIGPTETLNFALFNAYATEEQADSFANAFRDGYAQVMAVLRATGAKIVIANVPRLGQLPLATAVGFTDQQKSNLTLLSGKVSDAINFVGSSQIVPVVDLFNDPDATNPANISADGFHPNDTGYSLLADKFFALLRPLLPPPSPSTGAVISEYRLSGPGTGSNSDLDEFIEIFNVTNRPLDLTNWSIAAGGLTIPILSGRTIPAKGHLLLTNSGGYSLADYGGTDAAKGDLTYTGDITLGSTLTLRNASGTTVDEVTSVGLTPTTPTSQYSYARRLSLDTGLASSIPSDFNLVDVGATTFGPDSVNDTSNGKVRLGSPGPENLSSPLNRSVLYTNLSQDASQNTVRNASDTSVAPLGTLSLRRTVTNNTGTTLTKVRFRLINTTSGTPTVSSLADVRVVDGTASFVVGGVTVMPITVEKVAGATTGSLNSTFTLPLPAGGLTNGSSVSIDFKLGVFKAGSYRLAFLFEVLP